MMIAIAALTLLADAPLAPPTTRLSAGAKIERPVARREAAPFERLGAVVPVRKDLLSKPTQPIT
jgi:hypothetical protein